MKKRRILSILFFFICLLGIIYSLFNIFKWKHDINENKKIKEDLEEITEIKPIENNDNSIKYNLDFKKIREKNGDAIAYLNVDGTDIKYIVVKSNNNSYYLTHNFDKKWNVAGWIFADFHNRFDGTDKNLVIYGHNMKDGSMFGTLKNTFNLEWQLSKNNKIFLVTENDTYYYEVFSTYKIDEEDYYINTIFNDTKEYQDFLNELKRRTNYDYDVSLDETDKILTLSTCDSNSNRRMVLHAKLIKNN